MGTSTIWLGHDQVMERRGGHGIDGIYCSHVSSKVAGFDSKAGRSARTVQYTATEVPITEREEGFVLTKGPGANQVVTHIVRIWRRNHSVRPVIGGHISVSPYAP
jgi:hypothetical protein